MFVKVPPASPTGVLVRRTAKSQPKADKPKDPLAQLAQRWGAKLKRTGGQGER